MPVGCIQPIQFAISRKRKSKMENPTRSASAWTVRLLFPLSRIKKTKADAKLPMMRMKAIATRIFI